MLAELLRKIEKISIKHLNKKIEDLPRIKKYFSGKAGLEIGGPSPIFSKKGFIPVYTLAKTVDGCNFSDNTVWENTIQEGPTYTFNKELLGYQFIAEGTDLSRIDTGKYDFILSCHNLEHIANPLKALKEWLRVLKPGGALLVIVPDKNFTFDHNRSYTKFEHILNDYNADTNETDLTHLDEILSLHDLKLDLPAGNISQFKNRSLENNINRCLHHHVFSFELLEEIFDFLNIEVILKRSAWPYHMIIMGIKRSEATI